MPGVNGEPSIVSEVSSAAHGGTDYDSKLTGSTAFGVRGGLGHYAFSDDADLNRTAPAAANAMGGDAVTPEKDQLGAKAKGVPKELDTLAEMQQSQQS